MCLSSVQLLHLHKIFQVFCDLSRPQTWTWLLSANISSFLNPLLLLASPYHESHSFFLSYLEILREKLLVSIFCSYTPWIRLLLLHSLMCPLLSPFFLSKSNTANTSSFVNLFFNSLNDFFYFSIHFHF